MGIFDQIKNAFSKGEDELPIGEAEAANKTDEEAVPDSYTVQSGDTLWKIADQVYGNGEDYLKIFEANRDILDSPDRILPGQELSIPAREE